MKISELLGENWMNELMEDASVGATGSGSIASVPGAMGATIHRPSLFGYIPVETPKKKRTQGGKKSKIAK